MNLLGHLLLADRLGLSLAGTLLGDFVKGPLPEVDDERTRAIRVHRRVDAFTDAHPAFLASKRRLRPELGHWRGVAVDVFYDHVLARDFARYTGESLEAFTVRVYADLAAARAAWHGRCAPWPLVRPAPGYCPARWPTCARGARSWRGTSRRSTTT